MVKYSKSTDNTIKSMRATSIQFLRLLKKEYNLSFKLSISNPLLVSAISAYYNDNAINFVIIDLFINGNFVINSHKLYIFYFKIIFNLFLHLIYKTRNFFFINRLRLVVQQILTPLQQKYH